ncbi:hypothetical protein ACFL2K_05210 [Candidatus Margulisiibacteriota bacterium]
MAAHNSAKRGAKYTKGRQPVTIIPIIAPINANKNETKPKIASDFGM